MIKELWDGPRYTSEELQARLKFFIGIVLGLTLFGIVKYPCKFEQFSNAEKLIV